MMLNCMGLTPTHPDVTQLLETHKPHVCILTETKLVKKQDGQSRIIGYFNNQYKLAFSSVPGSPTGNPRLRAGHAGVILALHEDFYAPGHTKLSQHEVPLDLTGYLTHVALLANGPVCHIMGVYMPHEPHPYTTRGKLHDYIATVAEACLADGSFLLVGGDWNAVLHPTDRSSGRLTHYCPRKCHDPPTSCTGGWCSKP
jgi:exonuclease III